MLMLLVCSLFTVYVSSAALYWLHPVPRKVGLAGTAAQLEKSHTNTDDVLEGTNLAGDGC